MGTELVTPDEAIAYLRLDEQGLRQPREALRWLCRTGRLRYTKVGRYVRFRRDWLDELVERNAVRRAAR
jgi:excisionase family DNA binding protein